MPENQLNKFQILNIAQALSHAKSRLAPHSESAALDSQILLAHILEKDRAWILAHPEFILKDSHKNDYERTLQAIESDVALPYILGHWEFFGLEFEINPDVLIPRPETELLVNHALTFLATKNTPQECVDVGTGSGCIPIAIAKNSKQANFQALDISEEALSIARRNIKKHGLDKQITCLRSNLLDQASGPFDLLTANLPYIPSERLPELSVSKKEPLLALDGGQDGLKFIGPFLAQAKARMKSGACLLAEIDESLANQVEKMATIHFPDARTEILDDYSARPRLLKIAT